MCGIAGVMAATLTPFDQAFVEEIVTSQHPRGPDYQRVEVITGSGAKVVFGHNRLSIIDCSSAGHQPMWDVDRRLCLAHNGEIYNYVELRKDLEAAGHRFQSMTDTEVILESYKQWGAEAFSRFNGMFAFALFDVRAGRLLLVRDRFGVKPLFYAVSGGRLVFASTPTVMARRLGLRPNLEYVSRGSTYELYEDGAISPFDGISAVEPGHYLDVRVAEGAPAAQSCPYYCLASRVPPLVDEYASRPIPQLVEMVSQTIEDAVRIRLRSDVPVGIALSGGLDSSTIGAVVGRIAAAGDVHAFTFGDPSDDRSEAATAMSAAGMAGLRMTFTGSIPIDPVSTFFETLRAQAAPFPSTSVMAQYLVYKAAKHAGIKVVLGGQGADEAFMGYRKFQIFKLRRLLRKRKYPEALACAVRLLQTALAEVPRARLYLQAGRRYRSQLRPGSVLRLPACAPLPLSADPAQPTRVRQMEDVSRWSLPTLLRYEDRNSMAHSVESRLPFMDYRLIELGLALPAAVKVRRGYGKWILREAMRGRIPDAIRTARWKRGFDVAERHAWMTNGLGAALRQALYDRSRAITEWIAPDVRIDDAFSDSALTRRAGAFVEATTLIWLADASAA